MINLKKEIERLTKKQVKKLWANYSEEHKIEFLLVILSMQQPVIVFLEEFKKSPINYSKIEKLKENLDTKSKELIDLLIFRIYSPFKKGWHLNKEEFYTQKEIEMQKTEYINDTGYGKLKYYPDFEKFKQWGLLESIYRYHNGLKLLPKEVLSKIKNKHVIDGGAYIGDSAMVFLDYNPECVHSFEPCSDNFENLLKNIEDKKCESKIKANKFGLADENITLCASGIDMGFKVSDDDSEEKIECIKIDDYVDENNIDVGLIKLDVEGYEFESIKGAINTIKKSKPILLIAIYHTPKDFFEIKPYLESLNLGYKFMVRKLLNNYLNAETMLICY